MQILLFINIMSATQHRFFELNSARLTLRMCNQPLQGYVDVCFLLTRNTITTDFSILHARQIPANKKAKKKKQRIMSYEINCEIFVFVVRCVSLLLHSFNEPSLVQCTG